MGWREQETTIFVSCNKSCKMFKHRKKTEKIERELSGSLVFRTRWFHCCGPRFEPWWETKIPQVCMAGEKKKEGRRKEGTEREKEVVGRKKERRGKERKKGKGRKVERK